MLRSSPVSEAENNLYLTPNQRSAAVNTYNGVDFMLRRSMLRSTANYKYISNLQKYVTV